MQYFTRENPLTTKSFVLVDNNFTQTLYHTQIYRNSSLTVDLYKVYAQSLCKECESLLPSLTLKDWERHNLLTLG